MLRGGLVDCVHRVAIAATDGAGDSALEVFLRSAAKPFQAEPAVVAGVLDRLGLDDRHLAVACASHDGSPAPAARVTEILAAAGVSVDRLDAGDDGRGDPIRHECSGNHALGLALCAHEGWPLVGYLDPAHPLQAAMRASVGRAAGVVPGEAIDGCGMRAYRLTLGTTAVMFGRLAAADGALGRCAAAMRAHPELVQGDGGLDTDLMRAVPGLVAKIGAEALLGVGLADGRGLAVKVIDGAWRALGCGVIAGLREAFGLPLDEAALLAHAAPPVVNRRGEIVGEVVTALRF